MDRLQHLQLRIACLEMAKQVAMHWNDQYGVERRAEDYWKWAIKELPAGVPVSAPDTNDDIPF